MTDHQCGAGPLAQQFHKLAVQNIDLVAQFFQRHSILVMRRLSAVSCQPQIVAGCVSINAAESAISDKLKLKAGS